MSNKWNVYVIESFSGDFYYTGMSENPEKRLLTHNKGKVRATKHFKPFKLVYSEFVGERMEARERERYLKSATGRRWLREKMGIRTEGSLPD